MAALDLNTLKIESKKLSVPTLLEVQKVLATGLIRNFAHATVEVVDCPDLRRAPFHLAAEGLSSDSNAAGTLVDVGGPPYLLPHVDRTRIYDLRAVAQHLQPAGSDVLCIGAGAGYYPLYDTNCEGVYNMRVSGQTGRTEGSGTRFAVNVADGGGAAERCELRAVPAEETRSALLVNLFLCEGRPGKVIRVHCKQRIGKADFVTAIRTTLLEHFGPRDEIVGLGGVFVLKRGSARQHVMRDFSEKPLCNEEQLNEWLAFHEMPAELIAVGTLITADAGLDLRLQHFHSFSTSNWGGHYHNDTTPDICEYEGYFALGGRIVRIDQPTFTHQFGRD